MLEAQQDHGYIRTRGFDNLTRLELQFNNITDVSALGRLTNLTDLDLRENPLSDSSINDYIPALESSGATVLFDQFRKGDFDIELVFLYPFTEDQKNVLQYVARRWMSVITEDLPEYEFAQDWSGTCGEHSFEIPSGERVDDLRIYVSRFEDADGPAGHGGVSLLRDTRLPIVGCMTFNTKFLYWLVTGLHETGHVLGFGQIWGHLGFRQDYSQDDPSADTHFNGPLAIAAFNDAGGGDYTGAKVPVQKMDGSHWRDSVLEGEIMGPGGGPALSAITGPLPSRVGVAERDPSKPFSPWPILATAWMSRRPTPIPCLVSPPARQVRRSPQLCPPFPAWMLRRPMPMPCLVTIHTGKGGSRGGCPCFPETTA